MLTTTTTVQRKFPAGPDGLQIGDQAGIARMVIPFQIALAGVTDADILTDYTPGFAGQIVKVDFAVSVAVTTGSKLSTLAVHIGAVATTGGVLALTSANCTPKGAVVAGTTITALNVFAATDTISIVASSTTAFIEGAGWIMLQLLASQ